MADEPVVDKTEEAGGGGQEPENAAGQPSGAGGGEATGASLEQMVQESPAARVITPDISFVREIISAGGGSLKKCYQCAQCSVVCNVTPDDHPFPRKEMMWAQWGLKEKLVGNADVWLCHQCSDCTANCPRGAEPGRVIQAIGRLTLNHYSFPGFLARALGSPRYLGVLVAAPLAVMLVVLGALGKLDFNAVPRGADGGIVYRNFMPVHYIDAIYTAAFFFAAGSLFMGARRYWKDMARNAISNGRRMSGGFLSNIGPTLMEIMSHRRFKKCDVNRSRAVSHIFVFYSFLGLFITTTWAGVYTNIMQKDSPYGLVDPLKIVANTSAVAFLVGMTLVLIYRFKNQQKAGLGNYFDWLLIGLIYTVGVSGILTEVFRLTDLPANIAYPTYLLHLVSVLFLFIYAPFSKMAHMVYRAVAMVFAKATGREPA